MPTEIHKHAARMIWQGWSTLDIVSEIQNKFGLSQRAEVEHELFKRVGELRALIKEARDLAPSTAKKWLEEGYTRAEVADILVRPFLLSNFEIDGIVSRAQAAVESEQGGVA